MSFIKRRGFLIISVALYSILLPILLLYTLGYNINFSDQSIDSSVNIRVETFPLTSDVQINSQTVTSLTPTDIRILDSQNKLLTLKKDDHITENFVIKGVDDENKSVRISSMRLMSTNYRNLNSFSQDDATFISFVDSNVFYQKGDSFYIRPISIISSSGSSSINTINQISIDTTPLFEKVSESIFFDYDNKLILWNNGGQWNAIDLKNSWASDQNVIYTLEEFNINSIVSIVDEYVLFTNNNHQLYQLNLRSQSLSIIDTEVIGVKKSLNPNQIWMFNAYGVSIINDIVYGEDNMIISVNAEEGNNEFSTPNIRKQARDCIDSNTCKFEVISVLGGYFVILDSDLYFFDNSFDANKITLFARSVTEIISSQENIYFIDEQNSLYTYNIIAKNLSVITTLTHTGVLNNMEYIPDWNRLILYYDTFVSTIWYDPDVINENILTYNDQVWVDRTCSMYLFDRILLCKKNTSIIYYQNNKLF